MTRRKFAWTAMAMGASLVVLERTLTSAGVAPLLMVPVHRILDGRAKLSPEQRRSFGSKIWPEAVRDFAACGIRLASTEGAGQIRRSPGDRPIFEGLRRGVINLVVTAHVPMYWDRGRGLAGVSTVWEGYHVCLIALEHAHAHQVPFVSVNTCVHELLHVLLQDVFVPRPAWFETARHEWRIDWCATRLWLLHEGSAIRESTKQYLTRYEAASAGN